MTFLLPSGGLRGDLLGGGKTNKFAS
ncbi:MAG: hypothetical protein RL757_989, partial [Bacteroidota bacterium]